MRALLLLPLGLLAAGCWTPAPGQVDPTRYPWDQPPPPPTPPSPPESYCVISLDTGNSSGITIGGGKAVSLGCGLLPSSPPVSPPRSR